MRPSVLSSLRLGSSRAEPLHPSTQTSRFWQSPNNPNQIKARATARATPDFASGISPGIEHCINRGRRGGHRDPPVLTMKPSPLIPLPLERIPLFVQRSAVLGRRRTNIASTESKRHAPQLPSQIMVPIQIAPPPRLHRNFRPTRSTTRPERHGTRNQDRCPGGGEELAAAPLALQFHGASGGAEVGNSSRVAEDQRPATRVWQSGQRLPCSRLARMR
jgi:hypothetical protein